MALVSQTYADPFLNASELDPLGQRRTAVVHAAVQEVIGQENEPAIVLDLVAVNGRAWPKRVVLNKGNALQLAAAFGDDTDNWSGRHITIWSEIWMYQGHWRHGIKILPAINGAAPMASAAPPPRSLKQEDLRMTTRLMASAVFSGEFGDPEFTKDAEGDIVLDVDLAADELRQAGYEVFRLPDKYRGSLAHPLDDFIEAVTVGTDDRRVIDAIWHQVEAIVAKYGGRCDSCGPIGGDYVPFAELFAEWRPSATEGGQAIVGNVKGSDVAGTKPTPPPW